MFNSTGQVTETTIANVAVRLNAAASAQWVTPAESCGLLPGMARKQMLADGELVEGVVTVDELREASEVSALDPRRGGVSDAGLTAGHVSHLQSGTLEVKCFNAVRGSFKAQITL